MTVTICIPYYPALILGPGTGLNIVHYNKVLDSTSYVEIMVPSTVLGSTLCVKNTVLVSTSRAINTVLVD